MVKIGKARRKKPWLVYLYGPVTGHTFDGANGWREWLEKELAPWNIRTINPMRSLTFLKGDGPISGTGRKYRAKTAQPGAVIAQNMWDVCRSDMIAGNYVAAKRVSIGSVAEQWIGFSAKRLIAAALDKRKGNPHDHLHVTGSVGMKVEDLIHLRDEIIAAFYSSRYAKQRASLTKMDKKFAKYLCNRFKEELKEQGIWKSLKRIEAQDIKRFKDLRNQGRR